MSHTKQTPILEYTTATLPGDVSEGTIVYNTDESSLNYYNGTDWVTSSNWESTYTTMSTFSAVWNSAPSVFDADAAVYVSSNGNDLFDGRSMDKPRETIRGAISAAEDLITAGATGVRIEVLDGSSYGSTTEPAITISDKMHLYAPNATYTGEIEIFGGASVTLDKHISHGPVTPAQVLVAKGSGSCYYKSNLMSSGDNETSILIFQNSTTDLYVDVGQMFVKGRGGPVGVLVLDGRAFLNIGSIILEGIISAGNAYGITAGNNNGGGYTAGYIGSIKDSNSNISTNNVGVNAIDSDTEIYLRVGEIDTAEPYLISNGGNLYLDCLNITGTPSGTPNLEISNLTYNNSDWDSTYTTVSSNSANWGAGITAIVEDTTPELGGDLQIASGRTLNDQNDNEYLGFETQGVFAVNYFNLRNSYTGSGPRLKAVGSDTDIDINLQAKGGGEVNIAAPGGLNINTYNIKSLNSNIIKPIPNGNDSYIYIMAHGSTNNPQIGVESTNTNQGLTINAKGTGNIKLGNLPFDADQANVVGAEQDNYVLTYDHSLGSISLEASTFTETISTTTHTQAVDTTHNLYNDDTAGAQIDVTLLAPASHKGETTHMKIGSTADVVLTTTSGTINGAGSYTLTTQYQAVKVFSDGTNYFAMA